MDDDQHIGLDDAESVLRMRMRHLEIGMRMQRLALLALEELEARAAAGQPLGLSQDDARALLDAGRRLERDAVGKEKDGGAKKVH